MPNFGTPRRSITPSRPRILTARRIDRFAKKGMGIIIISDDIPEVITNCSRILIMREGRITDEVDGAQADENWISERMIAETEEKGGGSHEVSD